MYARVQYIALDISLFFSISKRMEIFILSLQTTISLLPLRLPIIAPRMFKASEDFEGGIDINHILNDKSLHDELESLGWTDHAVKKKSSTNAAANGVRKPTKPPKAPVPAPMPELAKEPSNMIEPLDITDLGLVDESNLTLTEHDMQDEGLLAEFDFINSQANDESDEDQQEEQIHQEEENHSDNEDEAPTTQIRQPPKVVRANETAAISPTDNSGIPTAEEAKRKAIQYKREGNNSEALKWLRYAKQVESSSMGTPILPPGALITPSSKQPAKSATTGTGALRSNPVASVANKETDSFISVGMSDPFAPLESAISEATKNALKEAKQFEKIDPKAAVLKLREYKALQQEMAVLQSRRNTPGASPALFHWVVRIL